MKKASIWFLCPILQINTNCTTREPDKSGGKWEKVVCEHVDRFRQPTGPHKSVHIIYSCEKTTSYLQRRKMQKKPSLCTTLNNRNNNVFLVLCTFLNQYIHTWSVIFGSTYSQNAYPFDNPVALSLTKLNALSGPNEVSSSLTYNTQLALLSRNGKVFQTCLVDTIL